MNINQTEFSNFSISDHIKNQMQMTFKFKFIKSFITFWRQLEELSENEKLKDMRNYYHKFFLNICWNTFFSFYVIYLIFSTILLLMQNHPNVALVPVVVLLVLVITDLFIQIKNELIEYVFMFILLVEAFYMMYEGNLYSKYQFHEVWLIFYCTFLIISIS